MPNISVKINYDQIDVKRLFPGKKGRYLDLVLMERDDAYGNNYMVIESVSKEERLAGKRGAILGNGKNMGGNYAKGRDDGRDRISSAAAMSAKDEDEPW